ncbi:hypothetical protein D3C85_1329780 [compost metagenome]
MRFVTEQVIKRQGVELLLSCLDQTLIAKAKRGAPQPSHRLDITLALIVINIDTLPALDDQRAKLLMKASIGVGVQLILNVFFWQRGY